MKQKMNKVSLVVAWVLLLTACGQMETASAPGPDVMENPTGLSGPQVIQTTEDNIPTAAPAGSSDPGRFRKYIGSTYPPLPAGFSEGFSMLIQDTEDYGLFFFTGGADKMLWLQQITHYDSNGNPSWEVKDVLDLSNVEPGLILSPDGCFLNGAPDSEIIVVSKDGTIQSAWRANTASGMFEVIPANGIKCDSDKAMNL
jgi:hypothetical protein